MPSMRSCRTISILRNISPHLSSSLQLTCPCYTCVMTKLLEEAIGRLRQLPENMQDMAARQLIRQLEEEPEAGDRDAVEEGRRAYKAGEFITLDQWKHGMDDSGH